MFRTPNGERYVLEDNYFVKVIEAYAIIDRGGVTIRTQTGRLHAVDDNIYRNPQNVTMELIESRLLAPNTNMFTGIYGNTQPEPAETIVGDGLINANPANAVGRTIDTNIFNMYVNAMNRGRGAFLVDDDVEDIEDDEDVITMEEILKETELTAK